MSLSGYIIEKYNNMGTAYTCRRLEQEAAIRDIHLQTIGVYDSYVTDQGIFNNGRILMNRDFVINRYKWGKEKDAMNTLASCSYNSLEQYNIYINKFEQIKRLNSKEFLKPKYVLGTAAVPYDRLVEVLGTPIVAKGLENSMGREISLLETEEDYCKLRRSCGEEKEWLFEEFIATSYGRDLRVYSVRGEAIACMQRSSKSDFRANVALGARVEAYEISPSIRKIAKDIYEQTQLDFLGIDLMFGENQFYFCEINVMPGLEGIEKASGINVAGKVMETIKGDF